MAMGDRWLVVPEQREKNWGKEGPERGAQLREGGRRKEPDN
jgi:hypothetical protein